MSHRILFDLGFADHSIKDPGNAGRIFIDKDLALVPIVTAGAETRTLASPQFVGQRASVVMNTDGGDCTVSFTGYDAGSAVTQFVLGDIGDGVNLLGAKVGGTLLWVVLDKPGVTVS